MSLLTTKLSESTCLLDTGETFILFNKRMQGNKRELLQLGVPIFGHIKEEAARNSHQTYTISFLNCAENHIGATCNRVFLIFHR